MTDKTTIDISKIIAPLPAFIRHQTDAVCCAVLMLDADGEYHIVAEGRGWKSMIVKAASRVLEASEFLKPEQARND
jgi:hypothetical protein